MPEVMSFLLRDKTRNGEKVPENRIGLTQKVKPFSDWQEFVRTVNHNRVKLVSPLDMVDRSWSHHGGLEKEVSIIFLGENAYGTGYVDAMASMGYRPCKYSVPYFTGLVYQLTRDLNGPLCELKNVCIVAAEPEGTDSVFKGRLGDCHVYINTCHSCMPICLIEARRIGGCWHSGTWGFLGEKIPGFEK